MIHLGGVKFLTKDYQMIDHNDPSLLRRAAFVWILFEEQKNARQELKSGQGMSSYFQSYVFPRQSRESKSLSPGLTKTHNYVRSGVVWYKNPNS